MGKYSKLGVYLQKSNENIVKLTFKEIENILGYNLPMSARKYQAWWANNGDSHTHAVDGWLAMGWKAKVDLNEDLAIFTKKRHVEVKQQIKE